MINENPSEARIRDVAQSEEIEEIGEKTMSETSVEITSEVSIMNQIIGDCRGHAIEQQNYLQSLKSARGKLER